MAASQSKDCVRSAYAYGALLHSPAASGGWHNDTIDLPVRANFSCLPARPGSALYPIGRQSWLTSCHGTRSMAPAAGNVLKRGDELSWIIAFIKKLSFAVQNFPDAPLLNISSHPWRRLDRH